MFKFYSHNKKNLKFESRRLNEEVRLESRYHFRNRDDGVVFHDFYLFPFIPRCILCITVVVSSWLDEFDITLCRPFEVTYLWEETTFMKNSNYESHGRISSWNDWIINQLHVKRCERNRLLWTNSSKRRVMRRNIFFCRSSSLNFIKSSLTLKWSFNDDKFKLKVCENDFKSVFHAKVDVGLVN